MVSQQRRPVTSRDRLLAAAAAEFAARGFDGAKVDRIAARARLNKAMIYYHFKNKAALYREVLVGVFRSIADAVTTRIDDGPPDAQVRQFIHTVADAATSRPDFAAMWLREMADGGVHIDPAFVVELQRVLDVLGGIINRGARAGQFRSAHPLVTQLSIVAPILFFTASTPARARIARHGARLGAPTREDLLWHIERATLGGLRPEPVRTPAKSSRRQRT